MARDLTKVVNDNEEIIWQGRPNKKCFILESIFNPMLAIALLWLAIDMIFIFGIFNNEEALKSGALFFVLFFLVHLMPVWLYLGGVIFSVVRYNNTAYVITDAGVYISGGVFSYSFQFKPFTQLTNISMHQGVFDQFLKVGDVVFVGQQDTTQKNKARPFSIINIPDYEDVYKMVTKLQRDIYSDTQYPNDLRPEENSGYHTKIKR